MSSAAEREVRDALVTRLRAWGSEFRVAHELNVYARSRRADVALIGPTHLYLFEIKSERDKLDRLDEQLRAFSRVSHATVLVAHERWFEKSRPALDAAVRPCREESSYWNDCLWRYPEASGERSWQRPKASLRQPCAYRFLDLLWRDELDAECGLHCVSAGRRPNRTEMIEALAWNLTGQEIARAVCRQLRGRAFAEADEPIRDPVEIARRAA